MRWGFESLLGHLTRSAQTASVLRVIQFKMLSVVLAALFTLIPVLGHAQSSVTVVADTGVVEDNRRLMMEEIISDMSLTLPGTHTPASFFGALTRDWTQTQLNNLGTPNSTVCLGATLQTSINGVPYMQSFPDEGETISNYFSATQTWDRSPNACTNAERQACRSRWLGDFAVSWDVAQSSGLFSVVTNCRKEFSTGRTECRGAIGLTSGGTPASPQTLSAAVSNRVDICGQGPQNWLNARDLPVLRALVSEDTEQACQQWFDDNYAHLPGAHLQSNCVAAWEDVECVPTEGQLCAFLTAFPAWLENDTFCPAAKSEQDTPDYCSVTCNQVSDEDATIECVGQKVRYAFDLGGFESNESPPVRTLPLSAYSGIFGAWFTGTCLARGAPVSARFVSGATWSDTVILNQGRARLRSAPTTPEPPELTAPASGLVGDVRCYVVR